MARNALFLAVDRAVFLPAVFTAHTARQNACAHEFDTVIAIPENAVEPAWIDWAQSQIGVIVQEVPMERHLGITKTVNPLYPPSCCYRYLFPHYLSNSYEKLIYLDADIRVAGDISRLFELDLGSSIFASRPGLTVAHDAEAGTWQQKYLRLMNWDISVPYGSSAVLVIDPQRWQALDFTHKVINCLKENIKICLLADESALNLVSQGEFQPISPVWNMITTIWLESDLSDLLAPAIFHHGGSPKPWHSLEWMAKTGDRGEAQEYRNFFRNSPSPHFTSIMQRRPTLKQIRRLLRNWTMWRLTGKPHGKGQTNIGKYRQHIQSYPFADKAQGITACDDRGVLRFTPAPQMNPLAAE
jgi:lipopolysaccharide biosynthesis glycosyltransferase